MCRLPAINPIDYACQVEYMKPIRLSILLITNMVYLFHVCSFLPLFSRMKGRIL